MKTTDELAIELYQTQTGAREAEARFAISRDIEDDATGHIAMAQYLMAIDAILCRGKELAEARGKK